MHFSQDRTVLGSYKFNCYFHGIGTSVRFFCRFSLFLYITPYIHRRTEAFFLHGEFCTTLFYILCLCAISHGLTMLDLYYVQCKFDAGAGRRNSRLDSCKIYKVLKVS